MNAIEKIEKNEANFVEQNHDDATYAKKITKQEAELKWDQNANIIISKNQWIKSKSRRLV